MEMLLATGAMILVGWGAASLTVGTLRSFTRTSSETDTAHDVSTALQYMTRDLQEAKQVDIIAPYHIKVYFPITTGGGTYDRSVLDNNNLIEYFRGNAQGSASSTGTFFYRKRAGEVGQRICVDINTVAFETPSPGSVDVTVGVSRSDGSSCQMVHRAIFMRNY